MWQSKKVINSWRKPHSLLWRVVRQAIQRILLKGLRDDMKNQEYIKKFKELNEKEREIREEENEYT